MSSTTYPLDAPARKAIDTNFALPGEAVDGADIRVNATGGMRLSGNTGANAGYGAATSIAIADFDVTFVVTPRWTDMRNRQLFTQEAGGDHLAFEFGNDAGSTDMSQGAYVIWYRAGVVCSAYTGYTLQQLKDRGPCVVRFTRDGAGNVTPRLNGVALTWNVTPTPYLGDVIRMFGGIAGGYGQFEGDVLRSHIANFEMTADEAAGAAKGESRGRLAQRGHSVNNTAFPSGTSSGFTVSSGAEASSFGANDPIGSKVRIRFSTTSSVRLRLTDAANLILSAPEVNGLTGDVDITITATAAAAGGVLIDTFVGSTTVSGFSAVFEGTVADHRPENCTSLNRWLEASGNNYHLLPVGGAKALNPQVPRERIARFRIDLAGAVAAGAAGPLYTLTDSGAGVLTVTPIASIAATLPNVTANSEEAGHVVQIVTNQSTGVTTVTNRNAGTATDAALAGLIAHTE